MTTPEADPSATSTSPQNSVNPGVASHPPAQHTLPKPTGDRGYFDDALCDAERMLKYAAEIGIEVDPATRNDILNARLEAARGWTPDTAARLLNALTWLAARLKPVTAESLKAYHADTRATVKTYLRIAIILACFIVPVSVASFVSSALAAGLAQDITQANDLAVKLRAQLGPAALPPAPNAPVTPGPNYPVGVNQAEVIAELQQYASTIRVIYDRSKKLNLLVLHSERTPFADEIKRDSETARDVHFEVTPGVPNFYDDRDRLTATYQQVRNYAQILITDSSVCYGAVGACLLPVLYALLGTCAYLLRTFEDQMGSRTFTPSVANSARFVVAAIGGAVVGLFNNFNISQQASLSPLALAFLVGYAVDVFFAFLEGLLKAFSKSTTPSPSPPPTTVHNPLPH